jgi:hypothetical protein
LSFDDDTRIEVVVGEEHLLVDFLLDQIISPKEVEAHHGSVVPHIITELLGHKQVIVPMDMDISDQQPSVNSACKLTNVITHAGCKPTFRFA